jgi:hypothetical protein
MSTHNFIDLTGQQFGELVVIKRGPSAIGRMTRWVCRCQCGKSTLTRSRSLRSGQARSCGCLAPGVRDRIKNLSTPEPNSGCWLWDGSMNKRGYGRMTIDRVLMQAHHASYVTFIGPVPPGQWVLHRCDTPSCVRPAHLFLGNAKINAEDRAAKGRNRDQNGEKNSSHKLTRETVDWMRVCYALLGWTQC